MQGGARPNEGRARKESEKKKRTPGYQVQPVMGLALAGLEARIGAVNDVDATAPTHKSAILVPVFYRLERIHNFHRSAAPL